MDKSRGEEVFPADRRDYSHNTQKLMQNKLSLLLNVPLGIKYL